LPASATIKKDASIALLGAEDVKEKLIALAGIGPNSLYDQVYAVKVRVKSVDSLVAKVVDKRKDIAKRSYAASDATDIVGVRLLCLYAEDLPNVIQSLISFLKFIQLNSIRLLEGDTLDEAIHEIKVYKSNSNARVYDQVHRYCNQLGLSERNRRGEAKIELEDFEGKQKTYSSIHFVCNALSYASGAVRTVPIEIQVRTIFEDTWGEIDHSLEYKLKQKLGRRNIPKALQGSHETMRGVLNELKNSLESAGRQAENVRAGYQRIFDATSASRRVVDDGFRLKSTLWGFSYENQLNREDIEKTIPLSSFDEIANEAKKLRKTLENGFDGLETAKGILRELETQIEKIDAILETTLNGGIDQSIDHQVRLNYFLQMESAISRLWRVALLKHFSPTSIDEIERLLEKSHHIYVQLEKNSRFETDAMLNFRLGCTLQELELNEFGEFFLNRAVEQFDYDENLKGSTFSAVIPHYYGYTIWMKRARLLKMALLHGNPRINRIDQRDHVIGALYYSIWARSMLAGVKNGYKLEAESLKFVIANNIISYVWEIRDFSTSYEDFVEVIDGLRDTLSEDIHSYKPLMLSKLVAPVRAAAKKTPSYRLSDTMMKYYHLVGDEKNLDVHRNNIDATMKEDQLRSEGLYDVYKYARGRTYGRETDYCLPHNLSI